MELAGKKYSNLEELEADARPLLSKSAYGYYAGGSESETTFRDNREAFSRYRLLPRYLVDVRHVSTATQILGTELSMPIIVAPMAMQRLCQEEGELAMAAGATSIGTAMTLSTMATCGLEEVAATGSTPLWFQLYVLTRRDVTAAIVRDAEKSGYKALIITVDAPRLGKREEDNRNKFGLPSHLSLKMMERITEQAGHTEQDQEATTTAAGNGSKFGRHFTSLIDDGLTWDFLPWIKTITKLPVLVKGILAPDDARKAVSLGVDGIIVSNHGGRQLDHAPSAIDVLPMVVAAVQGRVPVLVDGGVRRGTDVIKCLALGASGVLVGRPLLWALTLGGKQGVEAALKMLQGELELGMALLGCTSVAQVTKDYLIPLGEPLRIPHSRL
jgi:isopentenyl diphosphate isomerase/L-lactate dehydrogenase-like FMN-dependent dehydrogenase